MNGDLLHIVDTIHREKDIDREIIFEGIEMALHTAIRKRYGAHEGIDVTINRETGSVRAWDGEEEIEPAELGRIAAQTAKQVILQKIREAERDVIFREYENRLRDVVHGHIQRFEGGNIIVNLGRTEGIIPRREQVLGENFRPGEHIRSVVLSVKKSGYRVRIVLSRTNAALVRRLFELEIPEIGEHIIQVKGLVREAGFRTKIAVFSVDPRVDCVGACVGVRGSRIKNITDELGGEKIDIVRWDENQSTYISSALKPAEIRHLVLKTEERHAVVEVPTDQVSRAIGRKGQNVRLASRLTGWELDIVTDIHQIEKKQKFCEALASIEGVGEGIAEEIVEAGCNSFEEVLFKGEEALLEVEGIGPAKAQTIMRFVKEAIGSQYQE